MLFVFCLYLSEIETEMQALRRFKLGHSKTREVREVSNFKKKLKKLKNWPQQDRRGERSLKTEFQWIQVPAQSIGQRQRDG